MKLITAIAALALVAGGMDVEAQKRGKVGKPGNSDDDAPQIAPVAHLAIGAFSPLDPEERKDLAEAAEEGDEEALEELRAEHLDAIEAMIEALDDPESRALIELGVMLTRLTDSNGNARLSSPTEVYDKMASKHQVVSKHQDLVILAALLDDVKTELEAELESLADATGAPLNRLLLEKSAH